MTGTGSAGQVAFWSAASAITGDAALTWDAANDWLGLAAGARLGVGTQTPGHQVDLQRQSAALDLFGTTAGAGATDALEIRGVRSRGTLAAPSAVLADDELLSFGGIGYGATGFSGVRASLDLFAAENWTDAAQGTYFRFVTTPIGSTTQVEVARFTAAGQLQINLVTGTSPLAVSSTTVNANLNADLLDGLHAAAFQPVDADLTTIAALVGTGLLAHTGAGAWAERTLQAPAAGLTIANPAGVAGDPAFALADDLLALEGLLSTGIAVRDAASSWTTRTLVAPAAGLTIASASGVTGNPTFALANDLSALEAMAGTGLVARTAAETYAQRTITSANALLTVANGDGVAGNPTLTVVNSAIDHGSLTGLVDDDHGQYALLAGRGSGQTLRGGTTAGGTLALQSTSHGTKGVIRLSGLDVSIDDATGILSVTQQVQSSLATGTSPFSVASTTLCANLNADLLDGYHATTLPNPWVYAATANVTKGASSTAEHDLNTYTFPAAIGAPKVIRVRSQGTFLIFTGTPTWRLYVGSTVVASFTPTVTTTYVIDVTITVRTTGAPGTAHTVSMLIGSNVAGGPYVSSSASGFTTTGTPILKSTVQYSGSNALNGWGENCFTVEYGY